MAIDIITITGGLPRDAELRFTSQGAAVTNFTLANSDNRYDEQNKQWVKTRAMYLDVTIWDESADRKQNPVQWARLASELKQGDQVAIKGKLTTRTWKPKVGRSAQDGIPRDQLLPHADYTGRTEWPASPAERHTRPRGTARR